MTHEEIKAKAEAFAGWYHEIELYPGFKTKSYCPDIIPQWDMIREVRKTIDYAGQEVLDVGTMDGMWAFEAEQKGAAAVTTIDIWQGNYTTARDRFYLAREALNSKIDFAFASVEDLSEVTTEFNRSFDIIQCPGVLYHLENPILALRQMRAAIKPSGHMILETAVWPDKGPPMARFNSDYGIYNDPTTFWAMNPRCLLDVLKLTGWLWRIHKTLVAGPTERWCLLCKPNDVLPKT